MKTRTAEDPINSFLCRPSMNLSPGLLFRMRHSANFMETRLIAPIFPGKVLSYIKVCQYSVNDKKGQNTLDKKGQNKETVRKPSLILEKNFTPEIGPCCFFSDQSE